MKSSFIKTSTLLLSMCFALACGFNSGKSNAVSDAEKIAISGSLDFTTGFSKSRLASGDGILDSGELLLIHIVTGSIHEFTFEGSAFSAEVVAGDYVLQAKNSLGYQIKKILPSISKTSTDAGSVNLDSTVISELVDKIKLEKAGLTELKDLENLSQVVADMATLLQNSPSVLSAPSGVSDATRQSALMTMAIRSRVRSDIKDLKDIVSSDYRLSNSEILEFFDDAVRDMLNEFSLLEVIVSDNLIFSDATNVDSTLFEQINIDELLDSAGKFSSTPVTTQEIAIFPTVASDYSVGSFSTIHTSSFGVNTTIKSYDSSDLSIVSYGKFFYVLGKFGADFVEKFDITNPSINIYPNAYSTLDEGESSQNPQDLIFQGMSKAYLTRYGSPIQWIVNPNASSATNFKKGSIDLSVYDDGDGSPEISQGIIVGDKLFLAAQRLDRNDGFRSKYTPYIIVIDTKTNEEIDTGMSDSSSLKGIALPAKNPGQVFYNSETGLIYIQCAGQFGSSYSGVPRQYSGGIVTVNPTTYETKLLVDDGPNGDAEASDTGSYGGLIYKLAVASSTKGYFITYAAWGNQSLRSFNPSTGEVGEALSAFSEKDLRGLNVDRKGRLWVSTSTGITVLNSQDDSVIAEDLNSGLLPNNSVQFLHY